MGTLGSEESHRVAQKAEIATPADEPELADALALAFEDDPLWGWVLPDPGSRYRRLEALFRELLTDAIEQPDTVFTTEERAGAAVWRAPGRWQHGALEGVGLLLRIGVALGPAAFVRMFLVGAKIQGRHPKEPHWYLELLGTHPDRQGTGVGSALIRQITARCDAEKLPAYLETQRLENVEFYGRHGFSVTEEVDVPFGGPHLWLMWRPAPE